MAGYAVGGTDVIAANGTIDWSKLANAPTLLLTANSTLYSNVGGGQLPGYEEQQSGNYNDTCFLEIVGSGSVRVTWVMKSTNQCG